MNKATILGFVRHMLQIGAGSLATWGVISEDMIEATVGAGLSIISLAWMIYEHRSKASVE